MHKARNSIAVIKQEIEVLLTVLQFLGRLNAKASLLWSMCWRRWVHRSLSRFGIYPSEGSAQVYVSAYPTFVFPSAMFMQHSVPITIVMTASAYLIAVYLILFVVQRSRRA